MIEDRSQLKPFSQLLLKLLAQAATKQLMKANGSTCFASGMNEAGYILRPCKVNGIYIIGIIIGWLEKEENISEVTEERTINLFGRQMVKG